VSSASAIAQQVTTLITETSSRQSSATAAPIVVNSLNSPGVHCWLNGDN